MNARTSLLQVVGSAAPADVANDAGPSTDAAIAFLRWAYPTGLWVLTAIQPDRKAIQTVTFDTHRKVETGKWFERFNGERNLYWHVNQPMRELTKKAERQDLRSVNFLHIDIDPRPGEDPAEERERAKKKLRAYDPPPHAIIDSGGGIQAFWRLEEPIEINGDLAAAEEAARYNRQIEVEFGADACHNVDRIMRWPWSWNIPDEKKRKKGREKRLATVVELRDGAYPITAFGKAAMTGPAPGTTAPQPTVNSTSTKRLGSVDKLPPTVLGWCKVMIVQGCDPDNPLKQPSDSERVWAVVNELTRQEVPPEVIYSVITDPDFLISAHVLRQKNPERYARRQIERAAELKTELVLSRKFPRTSAHKFRVRHRPYLRHYNGDYLDYQDGAYREVDEGTLNAELYDFLDGAKQRVQVAKDKWEDVPFDTKKSDVAEVLSGLRAYANRDRARFEPPCWLDGRTAPAPRDLVAFKNGILQLSTLELLPGDPDFFTQNALAFDYQADAAQPTRWLQFLNELWPDDPDAINALQEWFGYLLTQDTSRQKILVLVGPKRSGKGTIGRVLTELIGKRNMCAPSLEDLTRPFGTAALIGTQLCLVSDARLGHSVDTAGVAELLLRVSGEDPMSINRKYVPMPWRGRLKTRFVLLANKIPRIKDDSGALPGRYVVLQLTRTFYGKEDPNLEGKLLQELPGIMRWALDGLVRLRTRGRFVEPASSESTRERVNTSESNIRAFVEEECLLGADHKATLDELYGGFKAWCEDQGIPNVTQKNTFAGDLVDAYPDIKVSRPRGGAHGWRRVYHGIALDTSGPTDYRAIGKKPRRSGAA